jgi:branched-chain amino acid transport system ATP-binding protein
MLAVEHLQSAYGPAQVLFDIGFRVGAGEVVTLLGRNGIGQDHTIQTIMGLLPATGGSAVFDDLPLVGLPPHRIAQAGLGLVPEGRQIFPTLTVEENLIATAASRFRAPRWTLDASTIFSSTRRTPRHMGNELSGGEQQMLAIGRALMTNPKLLILDEATEGLAPLLRLDIWKCLARLKDEGQAILIVDKHLSALVKLADRHTIIEKGMWCGPVRRRHWTGISCSAICRCDARPHVARAPLLTAPPSRMVGGLLPVRHDMPKSRPVDTAPHGEPAKSIGSIVNDLARQFKVSFDRQAHSLGLTRPQWQLLLHLNRHEGMTQTQTGGRARTQRPDRRQSRPSPGRTRLDRNPDRSRAPAQQVSSTCCPPRIRHCGKCISLRTRSTPNPCTDACAGHRPASGAACAHETQSRRGAKEGQGRGADRQRPAPAGSAEGPQATWSRAPGQAQSSKTGKLRPRADGRPG